MPTTQADAAADDPRLEPTPFEGRIGKTVTDSAPWWPKRPEPTGPNVVMIVLDDVGFAQLGCYGSSISTPNMDALAEGGIRYTNFHVTGLCSTTRASLLTGRNHHSVGVGFLADYDTGYPGYRGSVSPRAATVAEVLSDTGYSTYACGKWHLTPPGHMGPAGPFHSWPTQRGFDRYYGFLWGEDDQWTPDLWYDQHRAEVKPSPDYHLSEDLVARAKEFVSDHVSARPDTPFFLYLAFGACHAPHQAPKPYRDRYRGAFDHGWDEERRRVLDRQIELGIVPPGTELVPRNPGVNAWSDLPAEQRRLYARMQEVFAGFMEHTDAQIGVLVDFLKKYGLLDDTLIVLLSDNGASGEGGEHGTANEYRYFLGLDDTLDDALAAYDELGGPATHNHYPAGWAQAGNTPLRFYKKYTYGGGVRAPLIMHWPRRFDNSSPFRRQFHHVIDVMPTIAEVTGAKVPDVYRGLEQIPLHGTSMAYTFEAPAAESRRSLQYFETAGYRGVVVGEWKAVAEHRPGDSFDDDAWQVFQLSKDFSEAHDVAGEYPEIAGRLAATWWEEAEKYGVLPLDDRMATRIESIDPGTDRGRYVLLPGAHLLNGVVGPNFSARPFRVTAAVERANAETDGVLLAYGRRASGFTLYVKDNRLVFDYNLAGKHTIVRSGGELPTGSSLLGLTVSADGEYATARLLVGDTLAGEITLPQLFPGGLGCLSTQCGHNAPSSVSSDYEVPFAFKGTLDRVVIELAPREHGIADAEWAAGMARQ